MENLENPKEKNYTLVIPLIAILVILSVLSLFASLTCYDWENITGLIIHSTMFTGFTAAAIIASIVAFLR